MRADGGPDKAYNNHLTCPADDDRGSDGASDTAAALRRLRSPCPVSPFDRLLRELDGTDAYAVLGVSRSADRAEIRRAYRARVRAHHPDNPSSRHPGSIRAMQLIVASHELLEKWRGDYDARTGRPGRPHRDARATPRPASTRPAASDPPAASTSPAADVRARRSTHRVAGGGDTTGHHFFSSGHHYSTGYPTSRSQGPGTHPHRRAAWSAYPPVRPASAAATPTGSVLRTGSGIRSDSGTASASGPGTDFDLRIGFGLRTESSARGTSSTRGASSTRGGNGVQSEGGPRGGPDPRPDPRDPRVWPPARTRASGGDRLPQRRAPSHRAVRVRNHLGLSIVATILCAPVGAFGLVYSLRTSDRLARGDVAGARLASRRCRAWCLAATAAGVVLLSVLAAVGGRNGPG